MLDYKLRCAHNFLSFTLLQNTITWPKALRARSLSLCLSLFLFLCCCAPCKPRLMSETALFLPLSANFRSFRFCYGIWHRHRWWSMVYGIGVDGCTAQTNFHREKMFEICESKVKNTPKITWKSKITQYQRFWLLSNGQRARDSWKTSCYAGKTKNTCNCVRVWMCVCEAFAI